MATKNEYESTYNFGEPREIVVSNWIEPIEVLVPQPDFTEPLTTCSLEDFENEKYSVSKEVGANEVLLAHETDRESAQNILNQGFKPEPKGYTPLRNKAVFGWTHSDDVGRYNEQFESAGHVVLYKSLKEHCYVSSYESSASQLVLGEIEPWVYERKHVLNYSQYEEILWSEPELIEHLDYSKEDLINI